MRTSTILTSTLLAAALGCGSVSSDDSADAAIYVDNRPIISSVSPDHGPAAGGITVMVTGTGFDAGEANVVVGERAVAATVVSDSQLSFVLPPGMHEQTETITVFNDNGFAHLLQAFTYNPMTTLSAVTPDIGAAAGGSIITLTGTGFADGPAAVFVGDLEASNVVIVNDSTITAEVAALGSDRTAYFRNDVMVETGNGAAVLAEAFRYKRPGLLMARMGRSSGEGDFADSSMLYYIDPLTTELVPMFRMLYGIKGIDVHPDGTLYGLTNRRNDGGQRMLVTIDPIAEEVTEIGRVRMADDSDCRIHSDLTIAGTTLYGMRYFHNGTTYVRGLVTINPTTGVCVDVPGSANLSTVNLIGLATKDAGTLYYVTYLQGSIGETTLAGVATGTPVPITGAPANFRTGGMTFNAGMLWAISGRANPGVLLRINPATGVATVVDTPMPYYAKGLSRTPPSMQ